MIAVYLGMGLAAVLAGMLFAGFVIREFTVRRMAEDGVRKPAVEAFRATVDSGGKTARAVVVAGTTVVTALLAATGVTVAKIAPQLTENFFAREDARRPSLIDLDTALRETGLARNARPISQPAMAGRTSRGAPVEGPVTPAAYDPYLPGEWMDTVAFVDFSEMVGDSMKYWAPSRFDASGQANQNGAGAAPLSGQLFLYQGSDCTGATISGYSVPCRALDSVVFADQPSPPWVYEHFEAEDGAGNFVFEVVFADGGYAASSADLTRVYVRYSIFFEENGTGIGGQDYTHHNGSNKWWQFDDLGGGMMLGWYDDALIMVSQESPATNDGCLFGLGSNTWVDYYPTDTGGVQDLTLDGDGICTNRGIGGHDQIGIWMHHFVCMDFSPTAGSRIMSWGMYSEAEQGIAAYHNNMTSYFNSPLTLTDFDSFVWNGTWGGQPKTHPAQSYWFDEILVMTGSSGSCVTPPSFS